METTQLILGMHEGVEVWRHETTNPEKANAFIDFFYAQKHLEGLDELIWYNLSQVAAERISLRGSTRTTMPIKLSEILLQLNNREKKNYL